MDSVSANSLTMNPRPRLLHTWGSSLLAVAQKTYRQAEHLHGPLGFFARTLASFASPILHPMQCTGLAVVCYVDDLLLEMEDLTMSVFPPSVHVFRLVDEVALLAESLPELFDDGIAGVSSMIQHLPLFDPLLKPLLSMVGDWEWNDSHEHIKCVEQQKVVIVEKDGVEVGNEMIVSEEVDGWDVKKTATRKNMEEEIEEVEEVVEELEKTVTAKEGKDAKVAAVQELMNDPILDLFEEGWVKEGKDAKVAEVQELMKDPILDLFDEGWAGGRKRVV